MSNNNFGSFKNKNKLPTFPPPHMVNRMEPEEKETQPFFRSPKLEPRGDMVRNRKWNALLRIFALCASVLGMYFSALFSVDGFSFQVDERAWIGWGIAAIIVVIESVWQKFGNNVTLFVLALVCYAYGIITNVAGILSNRGGYDDNPWSLVVPIVFGIFLEVFPEPVLAWSISGDTSSDPIGKIIERSSDSPNTNDHRKFRQVADEIKLRIGK